MDNLNHTEMGGLFHILMELIFRLEWASPIIVPFGMGSRHCMRRERWELEFVSKKGFGPVSKIRADLCHWLCFDWIHPLLMFCAYSPPSYCPCLDSKFHFQQNVESVESMKFASHLNNDDRIPPHTAAG